MIEITPPRIFVAFMSFLGLVLWALGVSGKFAEAMHAQAMQYNEVYTGENSGEKLDDQRQNSRSDGRKKQ